MRKERVFSRLVERAEIGALGLRGRIEAARSRFARREEGQTTMEYVMIIGLIAAIIIAIFMVILWPNVKPAVTNLIDRIKNAITGGNIT